MSDLRKALEDIAAMTFDPWTNGAKAGEIARAALSAPALPEPALKAGWRPIEWERIAWLLAEQDGHDDPGHLIWEGSPPEPWGEVWCRYETQARAIAALFAAPEIAETGAADVRRDYTGGGYTEWLVKTKFDAEEMAKDSAGLPRPDTIIPLFPQSQEAAAGGAEAEFEIQCNDEWVAHTSGPREHAYYEALHYAMQYASEGPVELFEVIRKPIAFSSPALHQQADQTRRSYEQHHRASRASPRFSEGRKAR